MAARMMGASRPVRALELATAELRPLPDFVVFGAAKSGTTALYDYLGAHPLVVACRTKEIHFADRPHNAAKGARWYRSWFPRRRLLERVGRANGAPRARCGEATPNYLAQSGSARRLAQVAPDVRLVALLREPGSRAWSHYRMRNGPESDPAAFAASVRAEAETLVADGHAPTSDWTAIKSGYLSQSHYAAELDEWFASFSAEQILLVRSEDLFAEPEVVYLRICRHIGLPDRPSPSFEVVNESAGTPDLPADVRSWLDRHFVEPNARLSELTGGAIVWP